MIESFRIKFTGMTSIKMLSLVSLTVFLLSDVVAASRYVQMPGSNFIQQNQAPSTKAKFVEGEVLVKFKSNVKAQVQQYTTTNLGARSFRSVGKKSRVAKIRLQEGGDVIAAVQAYQTDPNVEHAQPNYIYYASAMPDDPSYTQLWGMKNTGQFISSPSYTPNNGISGYDIDAELVWDQITDCRPTVVAVLDTGINYTHTDLVGNMWDGSAMGYPNHGFDFVDNDNDPTPNGVTEAHGTHVAGTIGAFGHNGEGVTGVCWRANIMSVRVLGFSGSGSTSDIIQGIEFASDNGAKVINMSLGGENPFDSMYNDAITYARDRDVVIVVSAGNGGSDGVGDNNDGFGGDGLASTIVQACNFTQENLLCIAALDQSYNRASFSNYGATSVDVGAPGTNTLSSVTGGQIITSNNTGWARTGGWAQDIICFPGFPLLTNPANWCNFGLYANKADDRAYKDFDLSSTGTEVINVNYSLWADIKPGDLLSVAMASSGGDPFAGGGIILDSRSGSTGNFFIDSGFDISSCNTATCSIGFQLTSGSTGRGEGIAIAEFTIQTVAANSTSYDVYSGTSMASPHVAGIAALVRAFNPNYTYTQTVEAIKNGGEAVSGLSGKTTTGRAANAMGAIAYITEPTGVAAVVQ